MHTSPNDSRLKGAGPGTEAASCFGCAHVVTDSWLLSAVNGQLEEAAAAASAATEWAKEEADPALLLAARAAVFRDLVWTAFLLCWQMLRRA